MSRIANRVLIIPEGVNVCQIKKNGFSFLYFDGPKGKSKELKLSLLVKVVLEEKKRELSTISEKPLALTGTYNSIINSMLVGVVKGFKQELEIRGTGYKVEKKDDVLLFYIGKTHSISLTSPKNLQVKIDLNQKKITVEGIDKQEVTAFCSKVKLIKKPSAYHDKGIFFSGETRKLKPTKTVSKK